MYTNDSWICFNDGSQLYLKTEDGVVWFQTRIYNKTSDWVKTTLTNQKTVAFSVSNKYTARTAAKVLFKYR